MSFVKKQTLPAVLLAVFALHSSFLHGDEFIRFDAFPKNQAGWNGRSYWGGRTEWKEGELILRSTSDNGIFRGKICGAPLKARVDLAGRHFRITVAARGRGGIRSGFLVTSSVNGKTVVENACPEEFSELGETLEKVTFTADLHGQAPSALAPFVEIRGEDAEARLKYIRIDAVQEKGAVMTLLTPLAVVPENAPAPERRFRFSVPDSEVCVFLCEELQSTPEIRRQTCDAQGELAVDYPKAVKSVLKITAAARGAAVSGFAVAIPPEEYRRMSALAERVPPAKKETHILYIGDSLNDFDRGFNSVDRLEYFLNLHQPGRFVLHNYSVAGDYITRVEERMKECDGRYRGIFDRTYDLVLIALGTNDCRSLSTVDYARPLVPPEEARSSYERVIAELRKRSPGVPVWLLSPSYSNYDFQVQSSEKAVKSGRVGVRFGIPAHLENFSAMLKALADSGDAIRYIDIRTPMKDAFSPENYNPADGVHLSLKGHRLFSELLLRAFVRPECRKE